LLFQSTGKQPNELTRRPSNEFLLLAFDFPVLKCGRLPVRNLSQAFLVNLLSGRARNMAVDPQVGQLGKLIKTHYDAVVAEPLPPRLAALVECLKGAQVPELSPNEASEPGPATVCHSGEENEGA
jgi:hypothetical protein